MSNTATVSPKERKGLEFKKSPLSTFMNHFYSFGILIGIFPVTVDKTAISLKFKLFSWKSFQSLITLLILGLGTWIAWIVIWIYSMVSGPIQEMTRSNLTENIPEHPLTSTQMIISGSAHVLNIFVITLPFIL